MMKRTYYVLILILFSTNVLFGQIIDSLGIDNNLLLNRDESLFLNSQFKEMKGSFDFNNKNIAFYLSLVGYQQKQEYFKQAKEYLEKGQIMSMALQLIILNEEEKKRNRWI